MRFAFAPLLGLALFIPACTDATISQHTSVGHEFDVTVYSGGVAVKKYRSSGKVLTEEGSDGWFFRNKATGRFIRVSGTVTVEQAP